MDPSHIKDLRPDPRNARRHTPRNVGTIVDALHEVGAARSIVIDEDNTILAGNATIEAAAEAGIERVRVVEADGNEIIAVKRTGLTPEQKARLALYDNRAAEHAEWEPEVLRALAEEIDLEPLFYPHELAALLGPEEAVDPNALWKGMPEYDQPDAESWKQLIVHFANEQDYEAFSRLINQTLTPRTKWVWFPAQERQNRSDYTAEDES